MIFVSARMANIVATEQKKKELLEKAMRKAAGEKREYREMDMDRGR